LVAERKSHGKKMEIWGSPVRWLYSAGQREIGLGGNSCYDVHSCQACLLLMILMEFFLWHVMFGPLLLVYFCMICM
jgi:hypothetical protein